MLFFLFLCLINKTYRFRRINQTFSSLSSKVMKNQNHDPPFFLPLMVYSPETYRQNSREKHINYLILEQSWNFKYLIKSHANILDVKKGSQAFKSLVVSFTHSERPSQLSMPSGGFGQRDNTTTSEVHSPCSHKDFKVGHYSNGSFTGRKKP